MNLVGLVRQMRALGVTKATFDRDGYLVSIELEPYMIPEDEIPTRPDLETATLETPHGSPRK